MVAENTMTLALPISLSISFIFPILSHDLMATTTYLMDVLVVNSTLPTPKCTGSSLQNSMARFYTSLGHVAENSNVYLSCLIILSIFLMDGSNPISNILSASSNTHMLTLLRHTNPDSTISINLPGHATITYGYSLSYYFYIYFS